MEPTEGSDPVSESTDEFTRTVEEIKQLLIAKDMEIHRLLTILDSIGKLVLDADKEKEEPREHQ